MAHPTLRDRCPYCATLVEGHAEALSIYNADPFTCPACDGQLAVVHAAPRRFAATASSGLHLGALVGLALVAGLAPLEYWEGQATLLHGAICLGAVPVTLWAAHRAWIVARLLRRVRAGRLVPVSRAGEPEIMRWPRRQADPNRLRGALEVASDHGEDEPRGRLRIVDRQGALDMVPEPCEPGAKT